MKPLYLIVNSMIQELGGAEQIAGRLGVGPRRVYKYGQSPEESGGQIPLDKFIILLELAGPLTHKTKLQSLINEALAHVCEPAKRKTVPDALLTDLDRLTESIRSGGAWRPKEMVVECPRCTLPMTLVPGQVPTYHCGQCLVSLDC